MDITLQRAELTDANAMTAIQKAAFMRLYNTYHDEGSPYLRGIEEFMRWQDNPNADIYKILADKKIAGGITVYRRSEEECYLARIYVSPEMQNRGIATRSIALCEFFYPAVKRWRLDFPADQQANKRCYEKAGYRDTGERIVKSDSLTLAVYAK